MKNKNKKKWAGVSIRYHKYLICKAIAEAHDQSTGSIIDEVMAAGLAALYGDELKDIERELARKTIATIRNVLKDARKAS